MTKIGASKLGAVEQFCEAARRLSFSAAAEALGTTPSAISKSIRRLEKLLGIKLFYRSTRSIRLTEDGLEYYETWQQALTQIEGIEAALGQSQLSPRGTLRVSLPFSYGIKRVIPHLPRFTERDGARINVMVSLSNSKTDFITENFDMAVRLGPVHGPRLIAKPLHEAQFCVVATPAYLRSHGMPLRPGDLDKHKCIDLILPDTGKPMPWEFYEGGDLANATISSRLAFDHPIAALTAAQSGIGLARLLDFTVATELRTGDLVEVLTNFRPPSEPVSVVFPAERKMSARVTAFVDFLVAAHRDSGRPPLVPSKHN